jgi:hypothetical protein
MAANKLDSSMLENDAVTGAKLNPALVQGDIIYADGTDTIDRLAKGTASQVLTMNSGATAPEWAAAGVDGINSSANADAIVISSDEEVTMPKQPCFSSHNNANDGSVTGDGTVITAEFDVESFDQNADFDASTDTFKAPVTGRYLLTAQVTLGNISSSHTELDFKIVTSNRTYHTYYNPYVSWPTTTVRNLTVIADMDVDDTAYITLKVTGGSKTITNLAEATQWLSWFSGALIA